MIFTVRFGVQFVPNLWYGMVPKSRLRLNHNEVFLNPLGIPWQLLLVEVLYSPSSWTFSLRLEQLRSAQVRGSLAI